MNSYEMKFFILIIYFSIEIEIKVIYNGYRQLSAFEM